MNFNLQNENQQEFLKVGTIIKLNYYGLWKNIFSYVTIKDIIQLRIVNKKLYLVVKNTAHDFLINQKIKNEIIHGQLETLGSHLTNEMRQNLQNIPNN